MPSRTASCLPNQSGGSAAAAAPTKNLHRLLARSKEWNKEGPTEAFRHVLTKAPEPGIPEVSADTRVYYQPPAPLGVKFGAEQETLQNPLHSDETSNHSNRGMRMAQCLQCEKTDQQVPLLKMQFQDAEVHICPQCLPVLIHKPANLADRLPGMQPGQPPQHEHQ